MEYRALAGVYERLEKESSKLGKTGIIADFIRNLSGEELEMSILLLQGRVFPTWSEKEVGIATLLMVKAISNSTGFPDDEIKKRFRDRGDLGLVVEGLVEGRRQETLFSRTLTIGHVFENLRKLADVGGKGSQNRKFQLVSELLGSADPKEAKYIVRTVLGELRVGVAEGIVRDAIAEAFFPTEGKKEVVKAVEWAFFMKGDYAEVAAIAREKGLSGLRKVSVEIGRPVQVLLAEKSPSLEKALEAYENLVLEFKYDGMRIQIHKKGERIWLYTRKLENVTKQFPDIVRMCKDGIKVRNCIVEGEAIVMDSGGRPQPFQFLSQRIQRKYDIDDIAKKMPVQVNLFDVIHLEGEDLFRKRFGERRRILEGIIKENEGIFQLARQLSTKDIKKADAFYKEALKAGHEGLIVKNLDSFYQPGRRVAGGWLKVKPTMENLDLVIIGGTWGTGKRAGWLGSLILGCRDGGRFLQCGMIGTGIKEKGEGVTFDELTMLLKPCIESESGNSVKIKPKVVVEVAYEEIQKSPNYDSGYALRFPRVVRLRTSDKTIEQADSLERVERLYRMQSKQRS
jgi:DNA ligase-1